MGDRKFARFYDRQGLPCDEDRHEELWEDRRVALTTTPDFEVSTVYLGRPVNIFGDVPLAFETSASCGCDPDTTEHTASEAQARDAHERMVARLSAGERA